MTNRLKIDQLRLCELLEYNCDSGVFIWKTRTANRIRIGDPAGHIDKRGYVSIRLDGLLIFAHRLAWIYTYGELSDDIYIDHIDENKTNNRITNLRIANRSQNGKNRGKNSNNTSGVKGVHWSKAANKWMAEIDSDCVRYYVGLYDEISEAKTAIEAMREKLHKEFTKHE